MQKVALLGSAFNPPTLGHLDILQQALPHFDAIWLVPNYQHAFGKEMIAFEHRVQMATLLCNEMPESPAKLVVNTFEKELFSQHPGPIYTYDLLDALEKKYLGLCAFAFILGPDNTQPEVWQKFYRHQEIEQRFELWFAKERFNIHSVDARNLIASMADDEIALKENLAPLLPQSIINYVISHQLYRD